MLTRIEVINSQGDTLNLPLEDSSSGFVVQTIEGLDPVTATLVSSSFANLDGAQYQSSRREPRNLKIQLGFDPDFSNNSVRTLRNKLYTYFMPKTEVLIRFYIFDEFDINVTTQNHRLEILARVESFESPLFVKDPAVDISFVCFDPDFTDPVPVTLSGMSTAGLTDTLITYPGTVENGILFTLRPNRTVDAFTIYHRPPDGTLRTLDFTLPLLADDVLRISTAVGAKSVVRTRAGVDSPLLYGMSPQSNWIEFQPGKNYIRVYAVGADVPYDITYTTKYGGL